jgi:DNA-binding GntR family transcriptional regulator
MPEPAVDQADDETAAIPSAGKMRPVQRPQSLSAMVVDQLREMIITGHIDLGEQLSENVLAGRLGVSRTPVREAFMKLEAERLVDVRPQRGTFVFTCTADEVREICELRAILEAGAFRLGAARDRAGLVAALTAAIERAEPARRESARAFQPHDSDFHDTLITHAGNAHLVEAYWRISGRVRALRLRFIRSLEQVAGSQACHRDLTAQLAAGRDAAAEALLRDHVHNSYRAFLQLFEPRSSPHRTSEDET